MQKWILYILLVSYSFEMVNVIYKYEVSLLANCWFIRQNHRSLFLLSAYAATIC